MTGPNFAAPKVEVKLHLLLDHDGYLPKYAVIEPAIKAEIQVARKLPLEPGTIVVFDRGYTDYKWFASLTEQGVYFVTRQRWNGHYKVVQEFPLAAGGNILADQMVMLGHRGYRTGVAVRRVVVRDRETGEEFTFLTNQLKFAASTIAKNLSRSLADRDFFQGAQTVLAGQDLRGHQRQCFKDADLDRPDRHVDFEILEAEINLRLVALQSGGLTAPAVVPIP
jgi:hypothetical protein